MEEQNPRALPDFTSRQSTASWLCALLWLPVHVYLLPRLLILLIPQLGDVMLNVLVYVVGALWMLATQFRFLRADFDPLLDRFPRVLLELLGSYALMMLLNLAVGYLLLLLSGEVDNPNNAAVVDMSFDDSGPITALVVFLAPFVEECMFRAGIFGFLRRWNRLAAYILCMAAFGLYHVAGYALDDPTAWVYVLQYLPIGFLLCRIYERTNTLWASMLLHALVNYLSLGALKMLEQLL